MSAAEGRETDSGSVLAQRDREVKPPRQRRPVHGVLLLDKPRGMSSNHALQRCKRLFAAEKAGHAGSLDPLATGMLPICLGEATKLTAFMLEAEKRYEVLARLGVATDSGDAEGRITAELPVPALGGADIELALQHFVGETQQIPPMYSALKHEGERLYALARRGVTVDRPPRSVRIRELVCTQFEGATLGLYVVCSKGTYVRTLIEDIALKLGTVAHVTALRRTAVAPFWGEPMVTLETLESGTSESPEAADALLRPVDSIVTGWPIVVVDPAAGQALVRGRAVAAAPDCALGKVRLYAPDAGFFGVGEVLPDRSLVPRRIFPALSPWS